MSVVEVSNVSLSMPRTKRRQGSGRKHRLLRIAGETSRSMVPILDNVSFTINPGDSVAIVSGKPLLRTSLTRLVAGTLNPDSGSVVRSERVVAMIGIARAMGASFTLRQNAYLVGGLMGMTQEELTEKIPGIIKFADLGNYLDRYLRVAPSNARQRLAWSLAMAIDARVYAIDGTLVVGELEFRKKCWTAIDALREEGATFLISSHGGKHYRRFCDRGLYFDQGALITDTTVSKALALARKTRQEPGGE
ncbi:MAG: ABC transporter ATP-binding protein [Candidatus Nanopelagicales bacterium]|jgi:ABC-type polysaccharide/polyol phosphate transport system ATPase subunit